METWIAPRLRCGLGNRLFQTVAVVQEAHRQKKTPAFLLPRMSHWEHGNFDTVFSLCPEIAVVETATHWKEVQETPDKTVPDISQVKDNIVLAGFYQNSQGWNLSLPKMPKLPGMHLSTRDAYAVHFRFGDYIILPHYQVPYFADYYADVLANQVPKGSQLVVFSDDMSKVLPIIKELEDLGYKVDICSVEDTIEIFHIWASCTKGAICSNSTFSWWAAYFAYQLHGTKAWFPSKWMTDQPTPNILNLPFTQVHEIKPSAQGKTLKSFSYV